MRLLSATMTDRAWVRRDRKAELRTARHPARTDLGESTTVSGSKQVKIARGGGDRSGPWRIHPRQRWQESQDLVGGRPARPILTEKIRYFRQDSRRPVGQGKLAHARRATARWALARWATAR